LQASIDPLKYQQGHAPAGEGSGELCTVKLRYKEPQGAESVKFDKPVVDPGGAFDAASPDFQFAAAVAEFGMLLGHSKHAGSANLESVLEIADRSRGGDPNGYRGEFRTIAAQARDLVASTD
jgi:Ca-activated chloride channel family protein